MSSPVLSRVTIQIDNAGTQIIGILVQKTISETTITVESYEKSEQEKSHHFEFFQIIPEKVIINGKENLLTDEKVEELVSKIKRQKKQTLRQTEENSPEAYLEEMLKKIKENQKRKEEDDWTDNNYWKLGETQEYAPMGNENVGRARVRTKHCSKLKDDDDEVEHEIDF